MIKIRSPAVQSPSGNIAMTGGSRVRIARIAIVAAAIAWAGAAQATTVVVFVDPMTFQKHTKVFDTPGPDHLLICMEPPGTAGCTEVPIKKRR
jgi:hypothetical protein